MGKREECEFCGKAVPKRRAGTGFCTDRCAKRQTEWDEGSMRQELADIERPNDNEYHFRPMETIDDDRPPRVSERECTNCGCPKHSGRRCSRCRCEISESGEARARSQASRVMAPTLRNCHCGHTRADHWETYACSKARCGCKGFQPERRSGAEDRRAKKAYYDDPVMLDLSVGKWPRNASVPHWTDAEKAIAEAVRVVEDAGAHPLLTDAVILLADAQRKVAEYVDRQIQAAAHTPEDQTP